MNRASDELLMEAVRAGEVRSLGVLFDRHHASLYRFYIRITGNRDWSEDLTQRVFSRMLRHRDTYRPDARLPPGCTASRGQHYR